MMTSLMKIYLVLIVISIQIVSALSSVITLPTAFYLIVLSMKNGALIKMATQLKLGVLTSNIVSQILMTHIKIIHALSV